MTLKYLFALVLVWVEDPPALLASIPWNPTPIKVQFSSFGPNNEGEALNSTDHQMNMRHGTHALVTSSRGPGHKQRYYLPTRTLFSLRMQLTPSFVLCLPCQNLPSAPPPPPPSPSGCLLSFMI